MNIYILTFALVLNYAFAFSQNYATVKPNIQSTYSATNSEIMLGSSTYLGLKIDSVKTIGGNEVYYHCYVLRPSSTCLEKFPNWLGPVTVLKPDGESIFLNNTNDSLRIKTQASLNDKWHFCDFSNGNYFEAEITSVIDQSFAGTTDLVKFITLTLKDSGGNILSHDFNGKELALTENYGLLKAYDFYLFPSNTEEFILKGISSPESGIQNITAREVHDYDIGDEFQYEIVRGPEPQSGPYGTFRKIILTKTLSANEDTIIYTFEQARITSPNSAERDTLTEKIIVSESEEINSIPGKLYKDTLEYGTKVDNFAIGETSNLLEHSTFNNRLMKKRSQNDLYSQVGNCYEVYPLSSFLWQEDIHLEGLGSYYQGWKDNGTITWSFYKRLLYYKKGSEIWGTPIDFDALLSVNGKKNSSVVSGVFPNPFTDHTTLKIKNENKHGYQVILTDVFGKIVKEYSFNEEQLIIENDGSMKGMYFYKLYNEQNDEAGSGKLIVY